MEWILASASPRRKQLFKRIVRRFEVIPAKGEEKAEDWESPSELVMALAEQKAQEVSLLPEAKGKAVLGSDTVVVYNGEVLGKPQDEADAKRMLTMLSGKAHQVYTGVCIIAPNGMRAKGAQSTDVYFCKLTDEKIDKYIESGSPMDKAGAYGIQDGGIVRRIRGSYSNVVGLPCRLVRRLKKHVEKVGQ